MIEQQGQVIAADRHRVRVRLGARSGCPACDAGKGCGAGIFGRLLQRRPVTMEFANRLGASTGQAVMVGMPESLFLRLIARFYVVPLLAGLAGAAVGHYLSVMVQAGPGVTDALTLAAAVAGAALAFRAQRRRAEFPPDTAVHLLRVVRSHEPNNCKEVDQ
jgi:sigma-E factor negative regulatory protein RseC